MRYRRLQLKKLMESLMRQISKQLPMVVETYEDQDVQLVENLDQLNQLLVAGVHQF